MNQEKVIATLRKYDERIDEKDFDLDAWKSSAAAFIARTFGEQDGKMKQLENLRIDYSSWTLRDAPSNYHPLQTCKRKAREIIQSAIEELEMYGLQQPRSLRSILSEIYSSEELEKLISAKTDPVAVRKVLDKTAKGKNLDALAQLLSNYPIE